MLPVSLNITLMITGYAMVMAYLGLGLLMLRRRDRSWVTARRLAPVGGRTRLARTGPPSGGHRGRRIRVADDRGTRLLPGRGPPWGPLLVERGHRHRAADRGRPARPLSRLMVLHTPRRLRQRPRAHSAPRPWNVRHAVESVPCHEVGEPIGPVAVRLFRRWGQAPEPADRGR